MIETEADQQPGDTVSFTSANDYRCLPRNHSVKYVSVRVGLLDQLFPITSFR